MLGEAKELKWRYCVCTLLNWQTQVVCRNLGGTPYVASQCTQAHQHIAAHSQDFQKGGGGVIWMSEVMLTSYACKSRRVWGHVPPVEIRCSEIASEAVLGRIYAHLISIKHLCTHSAFICWSSMNKRSSYIAATKFAWMVILMERG